MILSLCVLYEHPRSRFLFLKLSSIKRPSNELLTIIPSMHLVGKSYLQYLLYGQNSIFTVWSKQYDPENPLMINCSLGKVSSTLIFKIIRTSRLVLTRSRRYSNLFLTEFTLTWPIIILNEFLFLTCLSPSILSLKRGLQTGLSQSREVSEVVSCIILKDKGFSLRRSAKYQKFQMKSNLPFYV